MSFISDLSELSRKELFSVINQLKRRINCLETEFIKYQTLYESYQKYFNYFNETKEMIDLNEESLRLKNKLKSMKYFNEEMCLVSLKKLSKNEVREDIDIKSNDVSNKREVFTGVDSLDDCSVIDSNSNNTFDQILDPQLMTNDIQYEDNTENTSNESQTKNIRSLRTKAKPKFEDNKSDITENDEQISDSSDEELIPSYAYKPIKRKTEDLSSDFEPNNCDYNPNKKSKKQLKNKHKPIKRQKRRRPRLHPILKSDANSDEDQMNNSSDEELTQTYDKSNVKSIETEREDLSSDFEPSAESSDDSSDDNSDDYNIIQKLEKQLNNKSVIKRQVGRPRSHPISKSKKYKCSVEGCVYRTHNKKDYNRHYIRKHTNERPFLCEECGKSFKLSRDLKKHSDIHRNDRKEYMCEYIGCGKVFLSYNSLRNHLIGHLGLQYKCLWEDCSLVFSSERCLKAHIDKHEGIYRCDREGCQYSATCKTALRTHRITHSEERPFNCSINDCNKTYKRESSLKKHQLKEHSSEFEDIPWIECPVNGCSYKTKIVNDLTKHKTIHNLREVCNICQKRFRFLGEMKRHRLTHYEPTLACSWPGCDRMFRRVDILNLHINSHTAQNVYSCDWPGCDKTFLSKTSYGQHMKKHSTTSSSSGKIEMNSESSSSSN